MAGSVNDAEYQITQRHAAQIDHVRAGTTALACRASGALGAADSLPGDERPIEGPAVTVADVDVVATMNYWEMTDLGSFPDGASVLGVQVLISGHPRERGTDGEADVVLPEGEAGAWAAAVLGREWFDHGYVLRNSGGRWERLHRYLVLLDADAQPVAAPDDFYFAGVSFGSGTVTVRALAADSEGRPPVEVVAPTQRSPSLLWPVELTGAAPEPILPAARALLSVLRAKGAVHHQFRLIAFRLSESTAHIRYQCRDTGIEHEIALSVPTEADFAEGYEFFRRAVPRLGALPIRTPEQWADELVEQFKELFATGLLGSPVTEPG
ncbi:hypothetical protein [Nocardia farcinica]|uniref:hypothetical protein n=1 Tax=Nocardia farcinica TaxID=37329 RepID=UPI0018946E5A|nr:hypothetical protein [Nocardia farcinica]MBF6270781.1 hypothetical protein [Nocardia farcinica]MCZ9329680.1 hypothetical protein [Nocardia farcinica]